MAGKRILLCSHAAWRNTGYGAPVLPLLRELKRHGYDAVVLAVEERGPGRLEYRGVRHYLPAVAPFGEDIAGMVADHCGAEIVVSLLDVWPLHPDGYGGTGRPWLAWFPVDQEPAQRGLIRRLGRAAAALSFSQWGADRLRAEAPDLPIGVIPPGVDTEVFRPDQDLRRHVRQALPEGAFLVGMVGTNLKHDRKALAANVAGWALFAREHPDAHLMLWTSPNGGVTLRTFLASQFPDVAGRVYIADQAEVMFGATAREMAGLYNGFDVLLHASAAEGYGFAIVEALACGTPVIGAANTSMLELIPERAGWLVGAADLKPEWSHLDGWWHRPTPEGVARALQQAWEDIRAIGGERPYLRDCQGLAQAYRWEMVGEMWAERLAA